MNRSYAALPQVPRGHTARRCRRFLPGDRLRRSGQARDRGSVSLFVAVCAVTILMVLALVVDGGGRLRALNHAEATAQEAARTGAQAVDAGQAISGDGIRLDRAAAEAAARRYLAQAGVDGDVAWSDDLTLAVTVRETYTPVLLPGQATLTGHGSASLIVRGG